MAQIEYWRILIEIFAAVHRLKNSSAWPGEPVHAAAAVSAVAGSRVYRSIFRRKTPPATFIY